MNNRPIILDYVSTRATDNEIPAFYYDREQDINMMESKEGRIPFIYTTKENIMLKTVTRIVRESDDVDFTLGELMTKTEVSRERDDECNYEKVCELYSKTFVDRERDDEDDFNCY